LAFPKILIASFSIIRETSIKLSVNFKEELKGARI
jgi:hypothetical protein